MKVAIITGTTQGLGAALFEQLLSRSFFVISISRNFSDKQVVLQKENKCFLIRMDLNKLTEKVLNKKLIPVINKFKKAHVYFFNNAFLLTPTGLIGNLKELELKSTIKVNFFSNVLLVNFIIRNFKKNYLYFVNVSSGAAKSPIVGWPLYCSTKAANEMFFRVLEEQVLENSKIKVFNIDPGVINTSMQKQIRKLGKSKFPQVEVFRNYHTNGELASPENVAADILKKISLL